MRTKLIGLSLWLLAVVVHAQDDTEATAISKPKIDFGNLEELLITGTREEIKEMPGSAHLIDKEALETFDYTDINRVMSKVPGVYIRAEDGYGLRPNIGLRGATSERSQKITLMEDGILIAPAPYSAPAAYYLPNVNRMQAVEVFKGPAAIGYGPHTVGGAINLVSRPTPTQLSRELDVSFGSDAYQKLRAYYGDLHDDLAYSLELLSYGSDGFKQLDGGGETGFVRNDINLRMRYGLAKQSLDIKLGYADETSDETYLGLSDEDFNVTPLRRYSASQMDRFVSEHSQLHVLHKVEFNTQWSLHSKVYVNRFERAWNKFDGFIGGPSTSDVLRYPDIFVQELAILRGGEDSNGSDAQLIDITNNDRNYGSQGIEFKSVHQWSAKTLQHELSLGLRLHHDYVERIHSPRGYYMQSGLLVFDGVDDRAFKSLNQGATDALALFIKDQITLAQWDITLGVRYETIDNVFDDRLGLPENPTPQQLDEARSEHTTDVVIPGLGLFYQYTDNLGFLFGVNKGFSPNAPSAGEGVDAEESTNIEFGLRYYQDAFSFEVIGFFSDYDNLIGRCRVSDPACTVGEEFNGGAVEIAGVELTSAHTWSLPRFEMPLSLSYTYTESAFQSSFDSSFSQWGNVQKGDALPYMPEHTMRFEIGVKTSKWALTAGLRYVSEMREQPGYGDVSADLHTQALTTLDVAGSWYLRERMALQLTVDNLSDEQEMVSRRPFGARPTKPRSMILTAKFRF